MIIICSDIDKLYSLPLLGDDKFSVEITSDDNRSKKIIMEIISKVFSNNEIIYKAYGIPNSIEEIMNDVSGLRYTYHKGDSGKFILRRYPEIIMDIRDNSIIEKLLNSWICAVYEGRYMYIAKPQFSEQINEYFQKNLYKDESCLEELWDFLLCEIESIPQSDYNSFIVTARSDFASEIKQIILDNL